MGRHRLLGAWPRAVFERIGPFDEAFVRNQDDEFKLRLLDAGGKSCSVQPFARSTPIAAASSRCGSSITVYGFYKVLVMRKHAASVRPAPARAAAAGRIAAARRGTVAVQPLGKSRAGRHRRLYALANLAASWRTSSRRGRQHLTRLPIVFAVLHLSYGFGFLLGVARLILTRRETRPLP